MNFIFSQNFPLSHLPMSWCTANLGYVHNPSNSKLSCTKIFMVFIWGHLLAFPTLHEFHFFTELPTKTSSYATVHQSTWPSQNSIQFKTFVHQDFYSTHWGTFVGLSNPHIARTTDFIFSQKSSPSHLTIPWCTANLGHVHNPPNSKLSCTNIFTVFIWGHL